MALKVMKFGGSSVADVEKIRNVARRVAREYDAGHDCVVVVSAMGKTTDHLVSMADEVSGGNPHPRELDMLLSTGEQVTIALMAMALENMGKSAISLTGRQVGIVTDFVHSKARIREISTERLSQLLGERKVCIVAGFQGSTENDDITTLGRGGSDLTAVAIAAALKADVCEIYTDVLGVFTTDPRVVPGARKIDQITFDEMLELATQGAGVLHNRSVECAKNYNVTLHVRSTFSEEPGTLVVKEIENMEDIVISGVAFRRSEAKITIRNVNDEPGVAAKLFTALAKKHIQVDMIIQNETLNQRNDIGFTVSGADSAKALEVCEALKAELGGSEVVCDRNVAKVSAVGVGMQTHVDVAATMFRALSEAGVNILSITTSEIKITVLIAEEQVDRAVQTIHDAFELSKTA
ncbi:aspartate kinase [Candidatus Sumerlaeota bacterium]|nr:aspartate kinase [Candidatus Sumerlaeota bacterium]